MSNASVMEPKFDADKYKSPEKIDLTFLYTMFCSFQVY